MSHSIEKYELALTLHSKKEYSVKEISKILDVPIRTLYDWISGKINLTQPKSIYNNQKLDYDRLRSYVLEHNDKTLAEYGKEFNVHSTTICKAFKKLGITRKKKTLHMLKAVYQKQ